MLAIRKARRRASAGDIEGLLELLAHGKRRERRAAARALGEVGDERALGPLVAALAAAYAEDEDLPPIIVAALGSFRGRRATEALTHAAGGPRDDEFYFFAHREALFALAERGVLEPVEQFSRDETRDPDLRGEAEALIRRHSRGD